MGSDRARVSYDPTRMWRGVIAQQGRVSLEADWNESIDIQAAATRELTLDVVGAEGTPDGGYAVSSVSGSSSGNAANQDLSIAAGVLYLGGQRLRLPSAITYSSQPDWLDSATDPTYTPISAIPTSTTEELVYLTATEEEVSAVEDPALADVAIGGPDTGQRLRILQRVHRFATTATTCSDAFSQLQAQWTKQGYTFEPPTMRLASTVTLLVGFSTSPTQGTPCQPAATGGYLGAENQMYRVEIVALDTNGNPIIAWGPDDASFIYRVTASPESGGTTTLTLATVPVDSYHYPQNGQAVQLLASAVQLAPQTAENIASYVASPTGIVTTLNGNYQPGSQQIALNEPAAGPIPAEYFDATATPQLFVRIWQGTGTATPGTPFPLTDTQNSVDTGLTVTLASTSGFHVGDFWRFALRPIQPAQIYPARYLNGPQPPDGPHTWAGPLAVINWSGSTPQITSCIPSFPNLGESTGTDCGCTICLTPTSSTTLQDAVNQLQRTGGTICLAAGQYQLDQPVAMNNCFSITIRGQGPNTGLVAPNGAFTLNNCLGCTIEDLAILFGATDRTAPAIALTTAVFTTLQRMQITQAGPVVPLRVVSLSSAPPAPRAITLDGTQYDLTIRDNNIMASVGVAIPPPPEVGGGLLATAMRIESNILQCDVIAIWLSGTDSYVVAFASGVSLTNNTIMNSGYGIMAVGEMVVEGALRIDGNQLQVAFDGITTSPSNCLITANDIAAPSNANAQPAPAGSAGTGIQISSIQPSQLVQVGSATIENNTFSGMTTAINVGTGPAPGVIEDLVLIEALRINQNTIQNCSNGIVVTVEDSDVTICDNAIRPLLAQFSSQSQGTLPTAWGISLSGGSCCLITDNTIDTFTVTNGAATGIGVTSTDIITISGNLIANLNSESQSQDAPSTGIAVSQPFSSCDVSRNQVRLGGISRRRKGPADLTAIQVDGTNNPTPAATASIADNTVNGTSVAHAVISVADMQDLQVSGNTVTCTAEPGTRRPAVQLQTTLANATIRCQGNLVHGGLRLSIVINGLSDTTLAVLGNITTGTPDGIVASPTLQAPWSSLNINVP